MRFAAVAPGAMPPEYATPGAAGADVRALLAAPVVIPPGGRELIPTGLSVAIPHGYEIQVRSRSGLAFRQGLFVVNSPGTIDCDYRGEVRVLLGNIGEAPVAINPGDRIAQLVLAPVARADFVAVSSLDDTHRGSGGFGSTGV